MNVVGLDTVELEVEGDTIVARCFVCHPLEVIGTWSKTVSLNLVINALKDHQKQYLAKKET